MTYTLDQITLLYTFHFILIFSRVGSALMIMPAFGETYVSIRVRLLFSLATTLVLVPSVSGLMPQELPRDIIDMLLLIGHEMLIGLFFGGMMRITKAVLHIAGMIIAFQSSLASALLFDANQGSQGSVVGNFLTLIGVTLVFVTDIHHLMLIAIADSYTLLQPDTPLPIGDMAQSTASLLAEGFVIAVRMSSPLIVIGLSLYLGAGLMARLMPNMQVFFILVPVQIYVSFFVFLTVMSAAMLLYLEHIDDVLFRFIAH